MLPMNERMYPEALIDERRTKNHAVPDSATAMMNAVQVAAGVVQKIVDLTVRDVAQNAVLIDVSHPATMFVVRTLGALREPAGTIDRRSLVVHEDQEIHSNRDREIVSTWRNVNHKAAVPKLDALNRLVRANLANRATLHHGLVAVVLTVNRANPPLLVLQAAVRVNLMDHAHHSADHNPVANHLAAAISDRHDNLKNSVDHDSQTVSLNDLRGVDPSLEGLNLLASDRGAAISVRRDILKSSADHDSLAVSPADLKGLDHSPGGLNLLASDLGAAISVRRDTLKNSADHDSRAVNLADHGRWGLNLVLDHSPGDQDLALKRFSLLVLAAIPVVPLRCEADSGAPSINSM